AGLHRYWLGLVKGRFDGCETPLHAADRELKEEACYGARRLDVVRTLTLAPVYMSHETTVVLARDLYPERLPGDEPEELEVVPWPLEAVGELALREDFSEGRSIAALFAAREFLRRERNATWCTSPPCTRCASPCWGSRGTPPPRSWRCTSATSKS